MVDRAQVEELAAARAERRHRGDECQDRQRPELEESLVDTAEAARILGLTPQYVSRLAAADRLPWIDAGAAGAGRRRLYRRGQMEVIARARRDRRRLGRASATG